MEIPNVVGQDQVAASSLLESAGFKVSVKQSYSDSVEQGKVISQSPSGSTTVSPGSTVTITVSQGKETKMVTVPSLAGMNLKDAQNTLSSLGLNYSIEYKEGGTKKDTVINTSPSAGQSAEEGSSVKIYVSKGQETTTAAPGNGAGNNNSGSGNNSQQRAAGSN